MLSYTTGLETLDISYLDDHATFVHLKERYYNTEPGNGLKQMKKSIWTF